MSLGDVIYDTEKKTFFTPNTGTIAEQEGNITQTGVVEGGPAAEGNPSEDDPPADDPLVEGGDKSDLEKGGHEGES